MPGGSIRFASGSPRYGRARLRSARGMQERTDEWHPPNPWHSLNIGTLLEINVFMALPESPEGVTDAVQTFLKSIACNVLQRARGSVSQGDRGP